MKIMAQTHGWAILLVIVLSGCANGQPGAARAAAPTDRPILAASQPSPAAATPTAGQMQDCPVTPAVDERPPTEWVASWDPLGRWHKSPDSQIWVSETNLRDLATLGMGKPTKVLWGKPAGLPLEVTGRRLADEASPILVDDSVSQYYLNEIINPMGIGVTTPGCWEIAARAGRSRLRIVVDVPAK